MNSPGVEQNNTVEPTEPPQESGTNEAAEMKRWIKACVAALMIFLLLRVFVFDINRVRGASMEPTLYSGDKVVIDKLSYRLRSPGPGEITVFRKPGTEKKLIKRLIACPGDRLYGENGALYVNGLRCRSRFLTFKSLSVKNGSIVIDNRKVEGPETDNTIVYAGDRPEEGRVPEGCYFVLGDNHSESLDSRELGFIPEENIVGKLLCRFRIFPPLFRSF